MEKHTSKFNNVHTQLLLQMQIDSKIQEMKDSLSSTQNKLQAKQNDLQTTKITLDATQNELQATKTTLVTAQTELQTTQNELQATQNNLKTTKTTLDSTQNELQTTKMILEQTMDELNHLKEDATKKENEIKFLQENIQKGVENIQKQNENGFKLNYQIIESFATFCSTLKYNTLEIVFKSLETKQPINQVDPIEPIEINGRKFEFPKVNDLVQNLNKDPYKSYEEKHTILLKKMKNVKIHHIDDKQLIFKLKLPKNHRDFYINHHNSIDSLATNCAPCVVVKNNQLLLLDCGNDYQIYLQIPNYISGNSNCYLYKKNGEKFLLKIDHCWNKINMDEHRTPSNEVLFYVTK